MPRLYISGPESRDLLLDVIHRVNLLAPTSDTHVVIRNTAALHAFAFVTVPRNSAWDRILALNGSIYKGKTLRVEPARRKAYLLSICTDKVGIKESVNCVIESGTLKDSIKESVSSIREALNPVIESINSVKESLKPVKDSITVKDSSVNVDRLKEIFTQSLPPLNPPTHTSTSQKPLLFPHYDNPPLHQRSLFASSSQINKGNWNEKQLLDWKQKQLLTHDWKQKRRGALRRAQSLARPKVR